MSTKAGQIVINIRAGTKQLRTDLKDGSGAVREFGKQTLTSMQGASAAIRLASGDITHNVRAVEQFLTKTLGMGDALKAIFPIVGAVAFGGLIDALATKVGNFFSELNEKAAQSRYAFANMDAAVRLTNDGLAVTNSRLKNELAQIEGLPQNNLRTALLEAQEAAHKLNQELERSIEDRRKLIIDQPEAGVGFTGWLERTGLRLAAGSVGTKDIADRMREFEQQTQGLQGEQLKSALGAELQSVKSLLATSLDQQDKYAKEFSLVGAIRIGNPEQRIADLKNYKTFLEEFQTTIQRTNENSSLGVKLGGAQDKHRDDLLDRPFENKLKALQAELEGTREKFEGVGTAAGEVMGSGLAKAAEDIAAVNKGLEKRGPLDQMNALQALQIIFTDTAIAAAQAENAWNKEFIKTTDTLKDRIAAQERLNAAIGGTHAQRKNAYIENALPGAIGAEHANDPAWMAAHPEQVAAIRGQLGQEFAGQESNKNKSSLQELSDKIRLTSALASAERDGAEAVRQAELAEKIRVDTRGMDAAAADKLASSMRAEYAEEERERNSKALAELKEKADAMDRLAGAYGRQARLQAEAQNAYDKTYKETGSPEVAASAAAEVLRKDQDEITIKAHEMATAYSDQMEVLKQTDAILKGIVGTEGARREVEQQILELEIKHDLQEESARAGLNAYFLEMQHQAKTTAEIVYDALTQATDKVTNDLANMATGKKPKGGWGAMFGKTLQDTGHGLVQNSLKSGLGKVLGHFGLGGLGKPDGTAGNPIHVVMAGGLPSGNAVPNPLGGLKGLGGLFGGGQQGTSPIFSALASLPGLAEGATDVYPGSSYVVGDGGEPEVFTPKTSGSVTPAHKIGGTNYNITVHAPNAEIGAENRIYEAVEMAHHAAVSDSVRADHELEARRPHRSGK